MYLFTIQTEGKNLCRKVSELIIIGKLRLHQLSGIDSAEIIMPFTSDELENLLADNEPWQKNLCEYFSRDS